MKYSEQVSSDRLLLIAGILLLLLTGSELTSAAQGVSTRNAAPATRSEGSGRPFLAKFTDVTAESGVAMRYSSGNETKKQYIIEANGSGTAMIDYDNDGNLDLFLVNGSRLEGFGTGSAPTNHLFRNTGRKAGRVVFEDVT
ncbi:MAG: FG-GAP repeat domain-containing protein, partial [Blastocatellia bacterium]